VIAPEGSVDLITVRRMWPDVLAAVKDLRRFTWTLLSHNAQVAALEGGRFTLAMVNAGARDSFLTSGSDEIVREALIRVLGVDWKVEAMVDPSVAPSAPSGASPSLGGGTPAVQRRLVGTAAAATGNRPRRDEPVKTPPATAPDQEAAASPDDADADDPGVTSHDLLARELGARVIGEYENS
jgi:DNA polymerase-3 subunit gamma/tau